MAIFFSKKRGTKRTLEKELVNKQNAENEIKLFLMEILDGPVFDYIQDVPITKDTDFFLQRVQVSKEKSIDICISTLGQQNERWKQERQVRITGSICRQLVTFAENDNEDKDWVQKIESVFFSTFKGNDNT